MVAFTWKNAAGGDWSEVSNWNPTLLNPPGAGDSTNFNDLANAYTVTVTTKVGGGPDGYPSISIDAVSASKDVAFSISGKLTADFIYGTNKGGPATSLTIEAGGSLIVPTLLFSIDVFETVTIAGMGAGGYLELGNLTVGGLISGTNSLMVLDFANAGPTTLNTGIIQFDNVTDLSIHAAQTITDVAWGNEFVFQRADFTGDTVTLDTATHDLTVMNGATTVFTMDNVFLQSGAANSFTIVNGNTIEAVCYVQGTMILTPTGEVEIERLHPCQLVITLVDGVAVPRPVKWVGHRRIDLTKHPRADTMAPIRVERHAFADNVPHHDLLLSPDHAVFTKGVLICVRQLVNGSTICRERGWTSVDYYHVELDRHAILLAEGLTAESYLDTGNSAFFVNSDAPPALHPSLPNDANNPTRATASCAPFVFHETNVRPVWRGLADRAAAIGRAAPVRVTTTDADPNLQCHSGETIAPIHRDGDRVVFALPGVTSEVRLVSRAQAPTEARPWLNDPRRLGLRVSRIVLRGADETREVAIDQPDFGRGWWDIEHDGPVMSRWTDGAAILPLPPMCGPVLLEIHLAGAMTYVADTVPMDGTAHRAA